MEMSNELKAKLYAKITNLADELGAIKEDGANDFDHYKFISYQALNALLRDLLPKYKLAIVPEVLEYSDKEIMTSGNKPAIRSSVKMSFMLVDTETGYAEERTFVGADQDTKGKSMGQAITECQKRFEMKLFHVSSTEADPDSKSVELGKKKESGKMSWGQLLNALDNGFDEIGAIDIFLKTIEDAGYDLESAYALTDKALQRELYLKINDQLKKLKGEK